jgi:hypothetical protein
MRFCLRISKIFVFTVLLTGCCSLAYAVVATKIINNGPDREKLVFAVVGDGYSRHEMALYEADVQRLVVDGIFKQDDFYRDNQSAFNVYRVDLESRESGISTPTQPRNTALRTIFAGDWESCWIEKSPETDVRVMSALSQLDRYDYVMVVLNEDKFGGCSYGFDLYLTRTSDWETVAHEYGHSVGDLLDEYWDPEKPQAQKPGEAWNDRNCSTELNRNDLVWGHLVEPATPIPTLDRASKAVGMFEGCNYKISGIFRPTFDCRMRTEWPGFCPVCRGLLNEAVAPYLRAPAASPGPRKYLSLLVEVQKNGSVEILNANEITTARALPENIPGDVVYQLVRNGNTERVAVVPKKPFVIRGFADRKNGRGEFFAEADKTTFVLNIPNITLDTIRNEKIDLNILKLDSEVSPRGGSRLQMNQLRRKIEDRYVLKADKFKNEVRYIPARAL